LQIRKSIGFDLKKTMGWAGLKRYNRFRGFLQISQETKKNRFMTQFLGGLDAKSLGTAPMVADTHCWLNSQCSRAREIARSGAKERG
jgi:hypothetical protein